MVPPSHQTIRSSHPLRRHRIQIWINRGTTTVPISHSDCSLPIIPSGRACFLRAKRRVIHRRIPPKVIPWKPSSIFPSILRCAIPIRQGLLVPADVAQPKMHAITNPYPSAKSSYTTTLAYLLRIPRRYRPLLLIGFCVFTFSLVFLNNGTQRSDHPGSIVNQRGSISPRRFVEVDGARQAVIGHVDGAVGHDGTAEDSAFAMSLDEPFRFANPREELSALLSVSQANMPPAAQTEYTRSSSLPRLTCSLVSTPPSHSIPRSS